MLGAAEPQANPVCFHVLSSVAPVPILYKTLRYAKYTSDKTRLSREYSRQVEAGAEGNCTIQDFVPLFLWPSQNFKAIAK